MKTLELGFGIKYFLRPTNYWNCWNLQFNEFEIVDF